MAQLLKPRLTAKTKGSKRIGVDAIFIRCALLEGEVALTFTDDTGIFSGTTVM